MKIAVSSYCFNQAIQAGKMSMLDVIPKAREMGFDGVEMTNLSGTYDVSKSLAKDLAAQSKQYGLPIIAYLTGADFLRNDLDEEVKRLHKEVEIALLMGAPKMRHDAAWGVDKSGNPVSFDDALPILAEGYRRVTEYAMARGVRTMIENHGYFVQDSARVKALIDRVNNKNFGWLVDIGNFLCADEDPIDAVRVGAPYAMHVHIKDFHLKDKSFPQPKTGWFKTRGENLLRGAIIGHGGVDVPGAIEVIKQSGYDGWLSIEFEGIEDCFFGIEEGYANLKSYL